ncbi:YflT domain-containing protein [Enemella evansiae]|uniref:General stress protein 17M-like domain-containing protein n=1 Tax=Enemella evansiae TaxID=2016499 RepID=A0A255G9P8_9ACTN|nr:general stress protein [Enemella evansiae]PFG68088.1 hypothetical protein B0O41_2914 [Propionibacteriaceae bacterium ES.041]OYN95713.1 hypothetical protein CGZ96_14525 [Enemella evansiae]OYO01491.1 hypothetical protein CGZ95_06830 [Enemella evansiae]OYO03926.1 hypothetical protein CGZ97_11060 [Enemella evansiae]OYO08229.1 hypothetical protein CGZ98_16930 [Enemella evansiae]
MSVPFQGLSFELEFPQSVGVYEKYEDAQRAVDFLADNRFPVQNLAIVGTDLKLIERVTGRKSWATVIRSSALSGISTGLLVGILLSLFTQGNNFLVMLLVAILVAVVISIIFGGLAYSMTGGKRDFNSVRTTVPSKYEILCEHKVAAQAREELAKLPGARAADFQ